MPSLGPLPIYGQKRASGTLPEKKHWRTLDELEGTAPAQSGEFPEGAAETPDGLTRRGFLQVLGASAALASLSACRPPRERVVSYVRRPEGVTPSLPLFFATAGIHRGYGVGLVAESREGRPTKLEGNRDHPSSLGGISPILQASILDLYEPNRLKGIRHGRSDLSFGAFLQELSKLLEKHGQDGGARLRFLVEPTTSPTLLDLRGRILERFPQARFDAWAPLSEENAHEGARIAFGQAVETSYRLDAADVILSLDADLLGLEGEHLRHAREFARRRSGERMNRLYVAEPAFTITGGMADHRFRMKASEVLGFGRAVAAALAGHGMDELGALGQRSGSAALQRQADAVAKDLSRARGRSLVVAGARQPAAVHALAHALNAALGNAGRTVASFPASGTDRDAGPGRLERLAKELEGGAIDTLVVTAWNPVYTAPADLKLGELLAKVPNAMYLALREDETSKRCGWTLGVSHPLEAWGDLRGRDGTATIVQPLIRPLHATVGEIDLLAAFVGEGDRGAYGLVREGWRARQGEASPSAPAGDVAPAGETAERVVPTAFERGWEGWLAAGVVPNSAAQPAAAAVDAGRVAQAIGAVRAPAGSAHPERSAAEGGAESRDALEVAFAPDEKVLDGRHLENAWLQEFPHPVTKLTWDNAAYLSPATAKRLGVADGDVLELAYRGKALRAPALVMAGHADDAVTLPLGYGQEVVGPVGERGRGFDAYALRHSDAPWFDGGLTANRTGESHPLAITQGHFRMEGRDIALAYAVETFRDGKEELEHHRGAQPTIFPAVDYDAQPNKWGMQIDLTKCIGCGACTVACQAENNIPVVGKDQVLVGREMHWIRVDRYFEGPAEDPQSVTQPLACVHCEMAPCEYVCPVNATVHSDEGINAMVYNRCVGTRYCSNNCPYKVRRFNYLSYTADIPPLVQLAMNPDVTIRARGVMEKCTYCTQRIERARIQTRIEGGKKIPGDAVVSACAQACPAEAIVFGNLNDPESKVAKLAKDERRYDLLHELGTRPRTGYLVRLRNPNPELA
jgi:MoCo/4Fe-4S cofactor protein with predicted Tat translocation signal